MYIREVMKARLRVSDGQRVWLQDLSVKVYRGCDRGEPGRSFQRRLGGVSSKGFSMLNGAG